MSELRKFLIDEVSITLTLAKFLLLNLGINRPVGKLIKKIDHEQVKDNLLR